MHQESETQEGTTLQSAAIRKIRGLVLRWGIKHYKAYPWRTPTEHWHGLIAEILLQRTRANSVVPVYEKFIETFPTPEKLGGATEKRIVKIIYPLGLRWRAPLLKQLGKKLARGGTPTNLDELMELPGVGMYVAAAYMGFHGGKRGVLVDANVVRLFCRLTDIPINGETRRKKWVFELADQLTPMRIWKAYNYALLDFTMSVCTKKPHCQICPIGPELCKFGKITLQKI